MRSLLRLASFVALLSLLSLAGGCRTTSKEVPSASAVAADAAVGAPSEPYAFNCIDGKVALGLGFGGFYMQSSAWDAPGKDDAAAARVLCARSTAIDACILHEKERQDGGPVGAVELVLSIARGSVAVRADGRPELARCMESALAGAAFGADGTLRYRYVVDAARGRAGTARSAHPVVIETSVTGSGVLPPDVVNRIVRSSLPEVRKCDGATAPGSMRVSLAIDASGTARAKWESGTSSDETTRSCVVVALGGAKFPAGDGATTAVVTLSFKPE